VGISKLSAFHITLYGIKKYEVFLRLGQTNYFTSGKILATRLKLKEYWVKSALSLVRCTRLRMMLEHIFLTVSYFINVLFDKIIIRSCSRSCVKFRVMLLLVYTERGC